MGARGKYRFWLIYETYRVKKGGGGIYDAFYFSGKLKKNYLHGEKKLPTTHY
jgi:hypothetical protein